MSVPAPTLVRPPVPSMEAPMVIALAELSMVPPPKFRVTEATLLARKLVLAPDAAFSVPPLKTIELLSPAAAEPAPTWNWVAESVPPLRSTLLVLRLEFVLVALPIVTVAKLALPASTCRVLTLLVPAAPIVVVPFTVMVPPVISTRDVLLLPRPLFPYWKPKELIVKEPPAW